MLGLLVALGGVLLIVGARDTAGRILGLGLVGALAITVLQAILASCLAPRFRDLSVSGSYLVALVLLGIIGLIAWRTRGFRTRAREDSKHRHSQPRERALPSPPRTGEED